MALIGDKKTDAQIGGGGGGVCVCVSVRSSVQTVTGEKERNNLLSHHHEAKHGMGREVHGRMEEGNIDVITTDTRRIL